MSISLDLGQPTCATARACSQIAIQNAVKTAVWLDGHVHRGHGRSKTGALPVVQRTAVSLCTEPRTERLGARAESCGLKDVAYHTSGLVSYATLQPGWSCADLCCRSGSTGLAKTIPGSRFAQSTG